MLWKFIRFSILKKNVFVRLRSSFGIKENMQMLKYHICKILILIAVIAQIFIFTTLIIYIRMLPSDENKIYQTKKMKEIPTILWWNGMPDNYKSVGCNGYSCKITSDRNYQPHAEAILFYGSDIEIDDLPLPRSKSQLWALLHEESPRNIPFMPYNSWLQHFNYTSTFSRHSDLPITTYYLPSMNDLTSLAYVIPISHKSNQTEQSPVLFMQSDCDTMSRREDYVRELMKYVKVDSYGSCLKNRNLPPNLQNQQHDYLNNLYLPETLQFIARYKFIISYENGVCDDYITEKFWRPLITGSIPIYFGSPTIKYWAPNEKSFIDIRDFDSPKQLGNFLNVLDKASDEEYNAYLKHKFDIHEPISNKKLLEEIYIRTVSINHKNNIFENFDCGICKLLHETDPMQRNIASEVHYQCSKQTFYPPMETMVTNANDWQSIMSIGNCKAKLLDELLQRNIRFDKIEFTSLLQKQIALGKC